MGTPGGAQAGWSPPRDLPQSTDAVSTVVATAGRSSDFIGFPGKGEQGVLARSPFGRVTSSTVVQREGFDGIGSFDLSATPSGRLAAAWGWYDASDEDDPDAEPCCTRAVAGVWPPHGRPYHKVLSPPGIDAGVGDAAAGPGGVNLFTWGGSDGMHVAIEHRGRFTDQRIAWAAPSLSTGSLVIDADQDLAFRADGRALLSWVAPGPDGTVAVWEAISDRAGRFGAPTQVGEFRARVFASPHLMTDARGRQVIVWTESDDVVGEQQRLYASTRAPGGSFGPPRVITRGEFSFANAAVGARGDAAVTWSRSVDRRTVVYVARRPRGGAFGRANRLTRERIDDETATGVDGAGRTMVLYAIKTRRGQVKARVALPRRRFGRPVTVSRRSGKRLGCFQPTLAVAPNGHAIGVWRCMGERLDLGGAQGAAYNP